MRNAQCSVLGFNLLRTVYVVNNENRCDTLLSCFAQTVSRASMLL